MTTKTRALPEAVAKAAPVPVPPEALALADEHERELAAIRDNPQWSAEHKARLIKEREDRTRAAIQQRSDAAVAEASQAFAQVERQIRTSVRFDVPALPTYAPESDKVNHAIPVRANETERRALCQDLIVVSHQRRSD